MTLQSILLQVRDYLSIPRLLFLLNGTLACSLAWMIGNTAALIIENELFDVPYQESRFVSPETTKVDKAMTSDDFKPIIEMNVFDAEVSTEVISVAEVPVQSAPGEILNQILSDLQLIGVFYIKGKYIYCTLKSNKNRREEVFTINEDVFETGAIVSRIFTRAGNQQVHLKLGSEMGILKYDIEDKAAPQKKAAISNTQSRPSVTQKPAGPPLKSSYTEDGKNFYIDSSEVDGHLKNFGNLLNQARMVPYFKDGKHQGFKVKAIDKGSLYEKLGLRNNDILKSVNGESLADSGGEKLMGMFQLLKNEREFTIAIERGGVQEVLSYHVN